jgi:predicted nuclease with TOPRIM domain
MKQDPYWFFKKWGIEPTESESLLTRLEKLEEKYSCLLIDVKRLEEENIELTNALYESENRLQSQIDNIHPVVYNLQNYTVKENNENFS